MPCDQVAAGGDGDEDAGPGARSELSPPVLAERCFRAAGVNPAALFLRARYAGAGAALREIPQQLSSPAEAAQEAQHGEEKRVTFAPAERHQR